MFWVGVIILPVERGSRSLEVPLMEVVENSLFYMNVTSFCSGCFVLFYLKCLFLYGPLCHGAAKFDQSTLFQHYFLHHLFNLYYRITGFTHFT